MRPAGGWAVPRLVRSAGLAMAIVVWIILAGGDGMSLADLLAGASAAVVGAALAWRRRPGAQRKCPATPSAGIPEPTHPIRDPILALLDLMAATLRLEAVVVWESLEGRLHPVHAHPEPPSPRAAEGDPLSWVIREDQPLRLEPRLDWPRSHATAVPLAPVPGRGPLVLSAEAAAAPPAPGALARATCVLEALLARGQQEADARGAAARFDALLALLKQLPARAEPGEFPRALANVAVEIAGARGGVVATWQGDAGQVLARVGAGGGPAENTYFGVNAGELALAARAGATIRRERSGQRPRPLAEAGERWTEAPRHLAVVPLMGGRGEPAGIVALWGDEPPEDHALEILEGLGPLLTLQLQQAGDVVRFRRQAQEDPLTGLLNRAALEEALEEQRSQFHYRKRMAVGVLVLDLDRFKRINDTYGHPAGDAVLRRVSDVIRAATRDDDLLARFGGEEFVVLLPSADCRRAAEVAERIRAAVEAFVMEWNGERIPVSVSIGVSACPDCVADPAELLRSADRALYRSKETGRNRVTTAPRAGSGG